MLSSSASVRFSLEKLFTEPKSASTQEVTLAAPDGIVAIPYAEIQRSHLVEE